MAHRKMYTYNGKSCCLSELVRISGLSRDMILGRIREGWSVEDAVDTPKNAIPPSMAASVLAPVADVFFTAPVPGVFAHMQPTLHKKYRAEMHFVSKKQEVSKRYYIIQLDNGKPLIVYPNEFHFAKGAITSGH